ncbi:MAG: hypothetical protein JEZ08_22815 [Clostridiales bacterium]|nr:hypothetical protein [Clostridiales bacterium]
MNRTLKQGIWILILGIVLGSASIVYSVTLMFGESIKLITPDEMVVTLETGHYTVYHEYQSAFEGTIYSTNGSSLNGFIFSVFDEQSSRIPVESSKVNSTYTINSRAGKSILSFDILIPGDYQLVAEYSEPVVLLIKKEQMKLFVIYLITGFLVIVSSLCIAIYLMIKKPKYEDDYDY